MESERRVWRAQPGDRLLFHPAIGHCSAARKLGDPVRTIGEFDTFT